MSKIVVLGGCGGIGTMAVRALASGDYFDEIVVADVRADDARKLADSFADPAISGIAVDANSRESLTETMEDATVVLNCVGPFYRFGPPILAAAIEAGVDYVDVCDDLAPTRVMLDMAGQAQEAGITALIGMGNSPGLANVMVKLCADQLLDSVEAVDIMHIHGGEPDEGPAVLKHRIHAMLNDIPLFIDGEFIEVRQLESSGRELMRETEFRDIGTFPVYPYPHPETITLPENIPGLRRATNLGVIFPLEYFHLTQDLVRVGICTEAPLYVDGVDVVPIDFAVAHLLSRRAQFLDDAGITGPAGCLKVEVSGTKDGETHGFVFSLSSQSAGAGEGTGIPAAVGAILSARGRVNGPGVVPPEAAVKPTDVLEIAYEMIDRLDIDSGGGVHVEHVLPDGTREPLAL